MAPSLKGDFHTFLGSVAFFKDLFLLAKEQRLRSLGSSRHVQVTEKKPGAGVAGLGERIGGP